MKNIFYSLILACGIAICLFSCKKDSTTSTSKPVVVLPEEIKSDRTLKSDTIYTFVSTVIVINNAILTIEAGTVIKSNNVAGGKSRSGGFAISRGSKIMAIGTADKPIVFTSGSPEGQRQVGDWDGFYIFGKAPISAYDENTGGSAEEIKLRGLGGNFPAGGGQDPDDNSGILKYVRIEFGGSNANDSYGLGCVGVGRGTVIDHVQTSYTQTSGFGFYGGTVNASNLVAFNTGLSGIVYAQGYTGNQQFILSYKHPYFSSVGGVFTYTCDGVLVINDIQNSPVIANTRPVISNLTVIGPYHNPGYNDARPWNAAFNVSYGSTFVLRNAVLMGMPKGGIKFSEDAAALHLLDGTSEFSNNLVHSNIMDDAYTIDPNNVYSIDNTVVNEYAISHNNLKYETPDALLLSDPFNFGNPGLLPKAGSPALSGADFSGADFNTFFKNVAYRGAFGTENWLAGWTNFSPVFTAY